jgi:hypothetical protein
MRQAYPAASDNFIKSYGWLLLLAFSLSAFNSLYVFSGVPYSLLADFIVVYTLPLAIMTWVVWDARSRHCTPCYDFGFLVYLGWIVAIPGYLVWTRGWRGLLILGGFVVLLLLPWIVPAVVFSLTA